MNSFKFCISNQYKEMGNKVFLKTLLLSSNRDVRNKAWRDSSVAKSSPFTCWKPYGFLASPLAIQLPIHGPRKKRWPKALTPALTWESWKSSWLLDMDWFRSGHSEHLGSKPWTGLPGHKGAPI